MHEVVTSFVIENTCFFLKKSFKNSNLPPAIPTPPPAAIPAPLPRLLVLQYFSTHPGYSKSPFYFGLKSTNFQRRLHVVLIIALVAKSFYLVSPPVRIAMETTAPTFQNLKLWTIQRMKVLKGTPSNYLIFIDMYKC